MDEATRSRKPNWLRRDSRELVSRFVLSPPSLSIATNLRPRIDDLPPHMFIKGSANSHGFVCASVTLNLWKKHFDYFYREEDWFVFPLTLR